LIVDPDEHSPSLDVGECDDGTHDLAPLFTVEGDD
jgi:hypothetical protein